ncbi:hypothetical protein [Streptomyces sp. NPDC058632]|uniref:hypothetical protein n=1 Tax=Streptomyces sp. NPDC058632 TaxID=3346567 RepID=UPI00365EC52F
MYRADGREFRLPDGVRGAGGQGRRGVRQPVAVIFPEHLAGGRGVHRGGGPGAELLRRPWQGITRRVAFDPDGHFFESNDGGGASPHRVVDGSARFVARRDDIGGESDGEA